MNTHFSRSRLQRYWTAAALSLAITCASASADDWYDPRDWFNGGHGEDEWYDPSDWFDGNDYAADNTFEYGIFAYDYFEALDETPEPVEDAAWGEDYWNPNLYEGGYWQRFDWADDFEDETGVVIDNGPLLQREKMGEAARASLRGIIEGVRAVRLQRESGGRGRFVVAQVRLPNDERAVVQLGRASQVEDLPLRRGQRIEAIGREGTLNDRAVLVAEHVTVGGESLATNPAVRLRALRDPQLVDAPRQTLIGHVESVVQTPPREGRPRHSILNLRLESGVGAAVDLGPAGSIDKISLSEGDQVRVQGRPIEMGGRQLLIPELIKVEDGGTWVAE